jgi:hypothetical protein
MRTSQSLQAFERSFQTAGLTQDNMIVVTHCEHKLRTLWIVRVSSEIQHKLAASDVPLALIRNDRRLVCGSERPLAACKGVIRVELDLPSTLCARSAPPADEG